MGVKLIFSFILAFPSQAMLGDLYMEGLFFFLVSFSYDLGFRPFFFIKKKIKNPNKCP